MMVLRLLPLAVGRLVKMSGTIRESIDGNMFMGLGVLDVPVVEPLRTFGLLLRRRCGVGGPHRVPPPIWILCGRGVARGALVHDGPSDRSHWEFDLRKLLINLRHSVRDRVVPCVGRLGDLQEFLRASRDRIGGGRRLLLVLRLSEPPHGLYRHRLGFEEIEVLGGRFIQRVDDLALRFDVLDGGGHWFDRRIFHGDSDARDSVLNAR